jgi:hypothetical protein
VNRHERRKAASQARQGQDTMGPSYSFGGIPESVRGHPAFKAGERAAESGEGFPPEYLAAIKDAARAIIEWLYLQTEPPELRWLDGGSGGAFIAANLDAGASYLADSDDARALLEWLDERTGRVLSLNMATWALRLAGLMPMPKGTK